MDTYCFNEGQLLDLKNNNVREVEHAEDVKLEGLDGAIWENKNRL